MNYFSLLCFGWASIGIISRMFMYIMGDQWKEWEMDKAYKAEKPWYINIIGVLGYAIVIYSWYNVIALDVEYSWIISLLVTLTTVKISVLLFNYDGFRQFAITTLKNKRKMMRLNISVVILSTILIGMGLFLY